MNIRQTILSIAFFALSCSSMIAQTSNKSQIVIDNIMTRASVRGFLQQPVPQEKIDTLLRAAMAAPTDRNLQPWHFVY